MQDINQLAQSLSTLPKKDQQQLLEFISEVQEQEHIHNESQVVFDKCWSRCYSSQDTACNRVCLENCVARFFDANKLMEDFFSKAMDRN